MTPTVCAKCREPKPLLFNLQTGAATTCVDCQKAYQKAIDKAVKKGRIARIKQQAKEGVDYVQAVRPLREIEDRHELRIARTTIKLAKLRRQRAALSLRIEKLEADLRRMQALP